MKASTALASTAAASALAVFGLEQVAAADWKIDAMFGLQVSGITGIISILVKARLLRRGVEKPKEALAALAAGLGLRLLAVGGVAVWTETHGRQTAAAVLAFAALYLVQQAIEVRYTLGAVKRLPAESKP